MLNKGKAGKNHLVVIAGPTGIGKTKVAVELASRYNSEVISFDSRQLYAEMKIGTAFPTREEQQGIVHHMLGDKSIHHYFNASMYENEVIALLERKFNEHTMLFMTGGTGFYLDAVLKGIDDLPDVDQEIRDNLRQKFEKEGLESIRRDLKSLDPTYYEQVDLHNPNRILKALEISIMTGKPYSDFLSKPSKKRNFIPILIGLDTKREELYNKINARVDKMIESGLVSEAKNLYPYKNLNALKTVGYKEIFSYLDGKTTLDEAVDLIKRNTRKYARRQLTWFRRYENITWFKPDDVKNMVNLINETVFDKE